MKKLNVRLIMLELGYSETSWKASRTRLLKKLNIENASDVVMVDVPVAERLIELVQEVKAKQLIANKLLGSKKYLEFTEVEKVEVKESKPKTTGAGTTQKSLSKTAFTELENKIEYKNLAIKELQKQLKQKDTEIEELKNQLAEYEILKQMAGLGE